MSSEETMRRPACLLCGTAGRVLYPGLRDRLFSAVGAWDVRACANPACGLLWLDPLPTAEELAGAYASYYTHAQAQRAFAGTLRARVLRKALRLADGALKRLLLIERRRKSLDRMGLGRLGPGRLLEVGCGDGRRLALLRRLGWTVEGQEVDPRACERTRKVRGLTVHLGPLPELALPADSYDAVVMNHVVEHVRDPVGLLAECRRLLRAGGTFVATTPNARSAGHRRFASDWMGLDPPRHLQVFSMPALAEVARRAGFARLRVRTSAARAQSIAECSLVIRRAGRYAMGRFVAPPGLLARALLFQYAAWVEQLRRGETGEECILEAVK